MKKIEKIEWFEAGLELAASEGFLKITIENLCNVLHVTKGSFYHHFGNMDRYVDALMQYWLEENTQSLIEQLDVLANPEEKEAALYERVLMRSHKCEQVIRGWSFSNETVQKYVREADRLRLDFSAKLLVRCGHDPALAKRTALLEYSCLVGIQQLVPDMPYEELVGLHAIFCAESKKTGERR